MVLNASIKSFLSTSLRGVVKDGKKWLVIATHECYTLNNGTEEIKMPKKILDTVKFLVDNGYKLYIFSFSNECWPWVKNEK